MAGSAPGPSPPQESTKAPSLLSKSFRLLNRIQQLLLQLFVALVGREIQTVKAGETAEAVNSAAIPILLPTAGSPPASATHSSCGKMHGQEQQLRPTGAQVEGTEDARGPMQPRRDSQQLSLCALNRAKEK